MIHREHIFRMLEEVGRAQTGGREQLTIQQVYEAYGGRGSDASRRLAGELGVSQRQVQRMVARETGTAQQTRGMGPKSVRFFREMSDRELRRAGARYLRDNELTIAPGSQFALCYRRDQQGDEREIGGDDVTLEDNQRWLDSYERGARAEAARNPGAADSAYYEMERAFTDDFLEAYGVEAGDLDVCDEDGGQNLSAAAD